MGRSICSKARPGRGATRPLTGGKAERIERRNLRAISENFTLSVNYFIDVTSHSSFDIKRQMFPTEWDYCTCHRVKDKKEFITPPFITS